MMKWEERVGKEIEHKCWERRGLGKDKEDMWNSEMMWRRREEEMGRRCER